MNLLDFLPASTRLWLVSGFVFVLIVGAGALYLNFRASVYREGWNDAHAEIQKTLDLQDAANREAMRLAEKDYLHTVDALTLERDRLNEAILDINTAAAADPDADRCGISADSVRRLNTFR